MKILNLKIKSPSGDLIRDIPFNETGISFIYGDIQEPENLGGTINSLGKTLLLKCIDYIFGANEDGNIIKKELDKYVLDGIVLFENKSYNIIRVLGNSEYIYIDNVPYTLTDYKNFFGIKRSKYIKQFILKKKATEISYRTNPSKEDVTDYLEMLNLNKLFPSIQKIYESQDKIKDYKNNKKELVQFYGEIDIKQIDEEIYFVDKEVTRLTEKLDIISDKIKKIEVSDMQQNIIEEYASKGKELKKLKKEYEKNRLECERLIEFINSSNKVDISASHIIAIYEKTKQEVPEMIKKRLTEVEVFHKKVYDERKEFLNSKKDSIKKKMDDLQSNIDSVADEIDSIGSIISMNEVYQESLGLYQKYSNDLQELKYKEGKLSQIKNIDDKIVNEDNELTKNFNEAIQVRKSYEELVQKYRDFIFSITKLIYDSDVNSFFDIKVRKKHLISRPVCFEFILKGDTGEGVTEVKKNLMDFLVFRFNNYMESMLQDSACFNGIDPRQVSSMIIELSKMAEETKKQVIVAINKYQLGDYSEVLSLINDRSVIVLSEKNKLLGFDF